MNLERQKPVAFYIAVVAFLTVATIAALVQQWWLVALPVIMLFYIWTFEKPVVLFYVLIASIPWSVEYQFSETLGTDFPDEPLMLLNAFMAVLLFVSNVKTIRRTSLHPVASFLCLQLLWTFLTLIQETVLTARYGLLLFGIFTTLFLGLFAAPVQQALYPVSTPYTAQVLQWCLPVLPAYLVLQVYGSVLTAMAQLKPFLGILAAAVFMNVALNVLWIPQWGALGCCMAALVSQYSCALSVYFFATWKNRLRHDKKGWLYLAGAGVGLAGLFYYGKQYSVSLMLLPVAGGALMMLALFTYLPYTKRFFILFR